MANDIQEYDDIQEYEDTPPVVKPPVSDEELDRRAARKAALEQPELESHSGLDLLGSLGSGVERSQMLPGKLLWGALDLAQAMPGTKIADYLTDTLAPKPIGDLARRVRETPAQWLKYYEDRSSQLAKEDEALNPSPLNRLFSGTTQATFELPLQLAAGIGNATREAAVKGAAVGQGIIGGLGKYAQERGEGADRLTALTRGVPSGLITGLTTRAFGDTGIESVFRNEGVKGIQNRLIEAAKDAGLEGAEEALDTLQQDLLDRITKNPNRSLKDTLYDVLTSAGIGTFLGGGVSGAKHVKERITNALESQTTPAVRDVREATIESEPEVPGPGSSQEADGGGSEAPAAEGKVVPTTEELLSKPLGSHEPEQIAGIPDKAWEDFMQLPKGEKWSLTADATAWAMNQEPTDALIEKLEAMGKKDVEDSMAKGVFPQKFQWYMDAAHVLKKDEVGRHNAEFVKKMADEGRIKITEPKSISSETKSEVNNGNGFRYDNEVMGKLDQYTIIRNGKELTTFSVKKGSPKETVQSKYNQVLKAWEDSESEKSSPTSSGTYSRPYFDRMSEVAGLGRISTMPTVEDVRAQRAQEAREAAGSTPEPEVESVTPIDPQSGNPLPPKPPRAPSVAGPGPAVLGEVSPQGTSLKNAVGEVERAGHGLPEATPTQRREMGEAWLESGRVLESDATAGKKLADDLLKNPNRGMSDEDSALLLRYKTALINAKNQAAEDSLTAKDPATKAEAEKRFTAANTELLDILDAAKERGASWGREGRWRQALAFEDFSLETMQRDKEMALGRKLTPAESDELRQANEKIEALQKQLADARTTTDNNERIAAGDEAVKDAVERARSERKKDEDSGVVRNLEQERKAVIERLKERFIEQGDLSGGNREIDKLMVLFARNGIDERVAMENAVHDVLTTLVDPTLTRQDTQDLMSGYGKFTPLSKDPIKAIVRGIKGEIQQVRKLLDFWQNIYPKQTGRERRVPTDKERAWIKIVNQAKKAFKIYPPDQASRIKSAIETVNTRLKNRISDLKTEIATRKKIVRERTPSPYNEETLRLRKEVESLQKEHAEIFGRSELTIEQRLKIAKDSAGRQIEELERQLKTGEVFNRNKTKDAPTDEQLEALRSRIEALKHERDNIRETLQPTMEPEAKTLLEILQRYSRLAEKYEERLANKDFAKKERKSPPVSEDTARAKARLEKAKEDFRNGLEKDRYDRSSVWKKAATQAGTAWDTARLFMTGGEFSFLLRQGKAGLLTRPSAWAKAIPPSMKALLSTPEGAATLNNQILESADAKEAQSHGLYLSETGAKPSAREEIAFGRMAEHLPFIRNFNQAGLVFLNKLRLDHYKALTKSLTQTGTPTTEEAQNIAEMVNIFSGRGGLGAAERIPTIMNRTFFSPRYLTSRFQMASGYPIWGGGRTPRARKLMAKEYARLLIGYGLYYSLLAGGLAGLKKLSSDDEDKIKVGTDPRSSDFGKVIVGNTRIDPLAGLAQVATLTGRSASGENVTTTGKVEDIRTDKPKFGGKKWSDVAFRFARTKANPVPGNVINWMDGTDLVGNPVSAKQMAKDFVMPMTYGDIYDALKQQDIPSGTAIALLAFLGEGVQTYNQGKQNAPAKPINAIREYHEK